MKTWRDEAIVLSAIRHGESDAVLDVLSAAHGRARGFVKGGSGRRQRAVLQAGNRVSVTWAARLEENLGRFTVELVSSPLGHLLGDGARLAALSAATAVIAATVPEREAVPGVHTALEALLSLIAVEHTQQCDWAAALVHLEVGLLATLGFGLDLDSCAATGTAANLVYVSPKTGRAVSVMAGRPYHDKLLPLPSFLRGENSLAPDRESVADGLRLTRYFLDRHVWSVHGRGQPPARERFAARFA